MTVFQRAEASTFFGREIGIMYMHAHLRYAEALARVGDGAGLLTALAMASPVGLDRRGCRRPARGRRRCYYSSSDAAFTDRYDAPERLRRAAGRRRAARGRLAGLLLRARASCLRLVAEVLLGVRQRGDDVEVDPVLPPADGLAPAGSTARLPLGGTRLDGPLRRRRRRATACAGSRVGGRELEPRPARPTPTAGGGRRAVPTWPTAADRAPGTDDRHRDHRGDPLT